MKSSFHSDRVLIAAAISFLVATPSPAWALEMLTPLARIYSPDVPPTDGFPDRFGAAVDISGDTLIVGMPGEDFIFSNGGQGAAHVFVRQGGGYVHQAKFIPSGDLRQQAFDGFGYAVTISGDVIAVATAGRDDGVVEIYERSGDSWGRVKTIAGGRWLGRGLTLEGGRLLVGAPSDESNRGAVLLYERSIAGWQQAATLRADLRHPNDVFGSSVALDGAHAVIGAPGNGTGVGEAMVFESTATGWVQRATLTAPNLVDLASFGLSVDVWNDIAVVGAPAAYGRNSFGWGTGAVFVYQRHGSTWDLVDELTPSRGNVGSGFGESVAIEGNAIVVSAPGFDEAYVFRRESGQWLENAIVADPAFGYPTVFPSTVAIDQGVAAFGTHTTGNSTNPSESAIVVNLVPESASLVTALFAGAGGIGLRRSIARKTHTSRG